MQKQNNKKCCSAFCKKISDLIKETKTKYNKSDNNTKKKIIFGIGGIAILFSGIIKILKRKKIVDTKYF